jgi:transposase-like protein
MKKCKCPRCGSTNIIKRGYRYNKSGKKKKRQCKDCGTWFTPDDGFLKMRFKKEHIVEAISLYESGLSLAKVKNHMWQHHGVKVCEKSVLNWVRKYSKKLKKYTDKFKVKDVGNIHADELVLKVGKQKSYRWRAKDKKTKFRYSGPLTKKREYEGGAKKLFKKIKDRCEEAIKEKKKEGEKIKIISDKLPHYKKAFNKYFLNLATLVFGVPIACKKYRLKHNNNPIERDHEYIRQRTEIMRGFKSLESGDETLDLMDIDYNFITPNKILDGRTPAEAAGIKLDLGRNRLLSLIRRSSVGGNLIVAEWGEYLSLLQEEFTSKYVGIPYVMA